MYRNATLIAVILLMAAAFAASCQSGSNSDPISPMLSDLSITDGSTHEGASQTNSHMVWGLWHIVIDPVTLQPEITPLRGIEWHANVVEFLDPPKYHNLTIVVDMDESDDENGYFVVYVSLTHPFPGLNQYRGFDVRGAFLSNGSYTSAFDNTAIFPDPDPDENEARLLNSDGYTRWFNAEEFSLGATRLLEYIPTALGTDQTTTSTLNPFKYFSDDFATGSLEDLLLQEVDIDVNDRGQFSPGNTITRRYEIQFEMAGSIPVFEFSYIVDASYSDPIPDDPDFPLDSFPISANSEELYKMAAVDNAGFAYYIDETTFGGNLSFDLELFDWQAPYNPSGVIGEIGSIIVESPTLFDNYTDGMIDITDQFNLNAVWASETSSAATIEIINVTPTSVANQNIFFTVTSADPVDYSNPFDAPYPEDPVLASYFMWNAPVTDYAPPNVDVIQGETAVDESNTAEVYTCSILNYIPSMTYTYLWSVEIDGDPVNYVIDTGTSPTLTVDWCTYYPGEYDMQVRVNDSISDGESPILDITRSLSTCAGNAHIYYGNSSPWPAFSYYVHVPDGWPAIPTPILDRYMLPRMDIDFFTRGDFAGQGVMQAGNAVLMNFVADEAGGVQDPPTQYKWRIPGMSFYDPFWLDNIPCSPRSVISLDTSPDLDPADSYDDNRIVIVTSHDHDVLHVLDADVTCPQVTPPADDPLPLTTLTDVSPAREIPCVAVDEDDDIWALVLGIAPNSYELHHWTYILDDNTGGPYYTYEPTDILDLSASIDNTIEIDVFDMVVAYTNNHLYILEAGPAPSQGIIHEIDLNTSPPTYEGSQNNIFSIAMDTALVWQYLVWNGANSDIHHYAFGADITIDHLGFETCEPEHCRLEVMGKLISGGTQVVRLDLDLNVMARNDSSDTNTFTCHGISSDTTIGDRVLVCPWYLLNDEIPPTSPYEFFYWSAPGDW